MTLGTSLCKASSYPLFNETPAIHISIAASYPLKRPKQPHQSKQANLLHHTTPLHLNFFPSANISMSSCQPIESAQPTPSYPFPNVFAYPAWKQIKRRRKKGMKKEKRCTNHWHICYQLPVHWLHQWMQMRQEGCCKQTQHQPSHCQEAQNKNKEDTIFE